MWLRLVAKDLLVNGSNIGRLANNKAEDLTIKKLTRGNQTMTAKFAELSDIDKTTLDGA